MEFARFQQLVQRFETRAAKHPEAYRREVGLLALAGYLYIAFLLVGLAAAVVGAAWALFSLRATAVVLKLILPLLVVLGAMLRALWVRFPRLEGIDVDLAEVPALAAVIEEIRHASGGPRIDRLVITTDLNAAVAQHPRLGILGWFENHLILGIPLLQTLPAPEVRAVLAHEFGHLTGNHGRFGAWIYRQRMIFDRFAQALEEEGSRFGTLLLLPMQRWYFPYFSAYSFALARRQEYDSDRLAARLCGASTVASALARMEIVARWEQSVFSDQIDLEAREGRPMPADFYGRYPDALRETLTPVFAETHLRSALRKSTDLHDSHPALQDRVRALIPSGAAPALRWDPGVPTGMSLLGAAGPRILAVANEGWKLNIREQWERRPIQVANGRKRLAALTDLSATRPLNEREGWEQVTLTEDLEGLPASAVVARAFLERHPGNPGARFVIARDLLKRDDDAGLGLLESVAEDDPQAILPAADLAFAFLWGHGRTEEAEAWRSRATARSELLGKAEKERAELTAKMPLEPHGLDAATVATIAEALARIPGLRTAYLARRSVKFAPDTPCYIVGVISRTPWWKWVSVEDLKRLTGEIAAATEWPGDTRIIPLEMELKPLRKKFRKLPDALIVGTE